METKPVSMTSAEEDELIARMTTLTPRITGLDGKPLEFAIDEYIRLAKRCDQPEFAPDEIYYDVYDWDVYTQGWAHVGTLDEIPSDYAGWVD